VLALIGEVTHVLAEVDQRMVTASEVDVYPA
jgi:hypothetical protein